MPKLHRGSLMTDLFCSQPRQASAGAGWFAERFSLPQLLSSPTRETSGVLTEPQVCNHPGHLNVTQSDSSLWCRLFILVGFTESEKIICGVLNVFLNDAEAKIYREPAVITCTRPDDFSRLISE